MAGPGWLDSYPTSFFPSNIAEGFIQRVRFRFENDKLRLSNRSLRILFNKMCVDEKNRALQMLKEMPKYAFAYHALRSKAKIKKTTVWKENDFVEALVDKVAGIPYGRASFLDIRIIKDKNNNLLLCFRVFRGSKEGKTWPTHMSVGVPATIATDIRNALDRLIARHRLAR